MSGNSFGSPWFIDRQQARQGWYRRLAEPAYDRKTRRAAKHAIESLGARVSSTIEQVVFEIPQVTVACYTN